MKRIVLALVALGALALAGCQTSQTSSTGWGQIAIGVGQVIGETKYDAKVAKASEQLAQYCGALRAVAAGASLFSPATYRSAARQAQAVVDSVCNSPPADVAGALKAAADAYAAAVAASSSGS